MRSFIAIIIGGLLWASLSQAVSKVGGGTARNSFEGFTMNVPQDFPSHQIYENGGIQLRGSFSIGRGFPDIFRPSLINIYILRSDFPELADVESRVVFSRHFLERG